MIRNCLLLFAMIVVGCNPDNRWKDGSIYARVNSTDLTVKPHKFEKRGIVYSGYLKQFEGRYIIFSTKEAYYTAEPFRELILKSEKNWDKCLGLYVYGYGVFQVDVYGAMILELDKLRYSPRVPAILPHSIPKFNAEHELIDCTD